MAAYRKMLALADAKMKELRKCKLMTLAEASDAPLSGGVYVIFQGNRALYAGLSKSLRRRFRQHSNGKQVQSAFTQKLAARAFRKPNSKRQTWGELYLNTKFMKIYAQTASKVARMKARYVSIDDARLRYIGEACAAVEYKTKWNDFNIEGARK